MWLFYALLFASLTLGMRRLDHANHAGMSMESVVQPEDTWLIVARNIQAHMDDNHEVDAFIVDLKSHLSTDGCMLHISKNSVRLIILVIHCPAISTSTVDKLTLASTQTYLDQVFGAPNVAIAKNGVSSLRYRLSFFKNKAKKTQSESTATTGLYRAMSVQSDAVWNLERIASRTAAAADGYLYTMDGSGVDVYVLDTGILAHHQEFIDPATGRSRATFLHNAVPDGVFGDCNGHGTHVAGIVGSNTYGVAKKVNLYGVRVLNCSGDGTIDDILEGADVIIEKAAAQPAGRRGVINLSLGGSRSEIIETMITSLKEAGLVVVMAAGNSGKDACQFSPSNMGLHNYALSVGASNRFDQRPAWSNYGQCVSLSAPGVDITSTWYTSSSATATISGTSMAAPGVSGVAALVLQQNGGLSVEQVNNKIVEWATPNVIVSTAAMRAKAVNSGASSLLYSLIDVNMPPTQVRSIIGAIPAGLPRHSNEGAAVGGGPGLILCSALTLLWLCCMV